MPWLVAAVVVEVELVVSVRIVASAVVEDELEEVVEVVDDVEEVENKIQKSSLFDFDYYDVLLKLFVADDADMELESVHTYYNYCYLQQEFV